ncbi:putative 40S ribosomal protein S11 [Paratrimastix pyriformis]|uniref:40S ribosomal protein S11 n=1 Tax=Paratrimastix pyriformis TaxID=342808 RepID=A0ABQ8UUB4_9EUKA|nr:putative 40S ribosomal protein S11 [Paratrimastix pyriformis]
MATPAPQATQAAAAMKQAQDATAYEQVERAYQKQTPIFAGRTRVVGKKIAASKLRFWRDAGLGFKTPREAIEGTYVDKKCPFTGNVSIRGHVFRAVVRSNKMKRTIIVRRDYLHFIHKYNRYEKRHRNIPVHCSPCFSVEEGDQVIIGQCRPLSKTVRFNVLKVMKSSENKKMFNKF